MKKENQVIAMLLALVMSFTMTVPIFAAETDDGVETLSTQAHTYSVLPGTDEWNEMTPAERLSSCAVSEAEVGGMTTSALIETVLNYPYLIDMYAYDTIEMGIQAVSQHFPGITELLAREDAMELLSKYTNSAIVDRSQLIDNNSQIKRIYATTLSGIIGDNNSTVTETGITPMADIVQYVYTPTGSSVMVFYNLSWNAHGFDYADAVEADNEFLRVYPSAKLLGAPNPSYNCHSYAWYEQSTSNKYWMDDPSSYMMDGSYVVGALAVKNKVIYTKSSEINHSGIVTSISNTPITVTSKWGACGLFSHNIDDCPYEHLSTSVSAAWRRA